jgi:hypothetical protein
VLTRTDEIDPSPNPEVFPVNHRSGDTTNDGLDPGSLPTRDRRDRACHDP